MKTQACLLMILMFRLEASSQKEPLQRKDVKRGVSEWEKARAAVKTLAVYGPLITAGDFLKRYSVYYQTHKGDFFSHRKALVSVGKKTGGKAIKGALVAFPFLMLYESFKQNAALKRQRLELRQKRED